MLTSSKLVDNLSEIYSKKCRGKKCESECEFKEFKNNKPINGLIKINEIRNKCIEIYELDPAHFLSAPRLAWEAYLKKKDLLIDLTIIMYLKICLRKNLLLYKTSLKIRT